MGDSSIKGHEKEHLVWTHMIDRCYNINNKKDYPSYGKIGVTVCERWHNFSNFLHDVPLVEGYNKELFQQRKLTLDKDIKQLDIPHSKRIYSLETCKFVTIEENMLYRDTLKYSKSFIAISPEGERQFVVGIVEFCKKHDLDPRAINNRLNGKVNRSYKGWNFLNAKCND